MEPQPTRPAHPSDSVRAQILASEHWSLLSTRSIAYNEIFSRTAIFLTVLSASVVALALVADATDFGDEFYVFAFVVLPVVLLLGSGTLIRLLQANADDTWLVAAMNRIRNGYLELAPGLEPYFTAGRHDDEPGVLASYGPGARLRPIPVLASTPVLVGIIDVVVAGVLAALVASRAGVGIAGAIVVGALVALTALGVVAVGVLRSLGLMRRTFVPRFPSP